MRYRSLSLSLLAFLALAAVAGCASAPVDPKTTWRPKPLAVFDVDTDTAVDQGLAYPAVEGIPEGAAAVLAK
jgi:hypothetical protein